MSEKWPSAFAGINWLDESEEQAVLDVLRTGSLFRYYGPGEPGHAARLEERARDFYGVKHALAVSSGTGALFTAMSAMGIGPGDEVIVPAFMWVATVSAVVHCNAVPVLCEVDDSFTMDPADLERKITPHTKLIVVVHMAGVPSDMGAILAVADARGIPVLEDCAQCNGGSFRGKKVGTFGRVGMFSFQINKNVTAGEGGLLVTDDEEVYWRMNAAHDLGVPWGKKEPVSGETALLWGQGRRMSELCGAVANVQIGKLAKIVDHMRESNHRIQTALKDVPNLAFRRLNDPEGDTGPFLILVLPDEAAAVAAVAKMQQGKLSGACRVADYGMHVYCNMPQLVAKTPLSPAGNPWSLPQNAKLARDYAKGACPAADALFARSIILNIPSRLSREQEQAIVQAVKAAL